MGYEITEEQKNSPLYKYFELPIKPVPEETAKKIMAMTYEDADSQLEITEIDRLFDDGYLPAEFGLFKCKDGGPMIANLTDMPGVTPEMFDWWFAWHGLDSYRYACWDKDDHYYVQTQNVEQALDESLSMKERYWNTTHELKEALVDGQPPIPFKLSFLPPEKVGFSPEKLKDFKGTIVCTEGVMIHFLRPTETGCELRTRFFMGCAMGEDGVMHRAPGIPLIPQMGQALLMHNVKEFTHLAEILPAMYNEFKDDFKVGL